MFSSKNSASNKPQPKKVPVSRDSAVTILTSGCHFNGKLYCRGSTRIGGTVEGEISSEGLLIIEEGATIKANIRAEEAVIQGRIEGKLEARGRVELCSSASFDGDIVTPVLVIREGAQFNGRSTMTQASAQPEIKAPTKLKDRHKSPAIDSIAPSAADSLTEVAMVRVPEINANA